MLLGMLVAFIVLSYNNTLAQGCCSGGSGSPIVGDASQGVLQLNQMEISPSYQYQYSSKFKTLQKDTAKLFDKLYSNYLYGRIGYGLTEKLTLSVEAGYFINKIQVGLDNLDTIRSSGIGDLIIFPRYQLYNKASATSRTEVVIGLGYKIPLGKYNDSTLIYTNPNNGQRFFITSPPTVQPTTGSQDFIFYGFALKDFTSKRFKVFTNIIYIRKGWNALGQKFGDYLSVGLFANRTFFDKLGVSLQLRGEYVAKMKADKNVDMVALFNVYPESTGTKKLFFVPQLSYTQNKFTYFLAVETPLYQYANGTQVVSQIQGTVGFSYRFFTKSPDCKIEIENN